MVTSPLVTALTRLKSKYSFGSKFQNLKPLWSWSHVLALLAETHVSSTNAIVSLLLSAASSVLLGNWSEVQIRGLYFRSPESEILETYPQICFNLPFRWFSHTVKSENHSGNSSELPFLAINPFVQGWVFQYIMRAIPNEFPHSLGWGRGVWRIWLTDQILSTPCFYKQSSRGTQLSLIALNVVNDYFMHNS